MSIISTPGADFCKLPFIFTTEKNLLIKKRVDIAKVLEAEDLPDKSTIELCLKNQVVSDWFSETDKDYTALMLEKDCPIPSGLVEMPLRQFFWETKNHEQKSNAQNSNLGGLAARAHGFLKLREKYRFCPTCGKPLIDDKKFAARFCVSCQKQIFPQIEPAIIVLVSKGNEVLLVKSKTVVTNKFSCVAGFVEHGEAIEETVAREVFEETGVKVKNIKYKGSQPWPFPDQLMLAFTADYESGEIKIQEEEIMEAAWFNKDSLPEIPTPGSVAYNLIMGKFKTDF